jgi:hypothetical protein
MIKPVSQDEAVQYLTQFFSPAASVALAAELFRLEDEAGENYVLNRFVCTGWEEFPSFEAAQASQHHSALGVIFEGGFLLKK